MKVLASGPSKEGESRSGARRNGGAGRAAEAAIRKWEHSIVTSGALPTTAASLRDAVTAFLEGEDDVLVVVGGTGVGPSDVTIETIRPLYEKELVGFGELVRRLGSEKLGGAAVMLRSTAGVARGKLIICLPASAGIARATLGAFAGEFPHIIYVARKGLRK